MDVDNQTVTRFGLHMDQPVWRNFTWDFSSAVFISLFNAVFGQFYIPMALRHGATNLEVGLLTAAPAIGLLFSPIWAAMVATRSLKPFIIWPNFIARASIIFVALFTTPWVFVSVSLFINLLSGIQSPAYAALLTKMYPAHIRGRLMGYVRVALGFVMIPLAYLIGWWTDKAGDSGALIGAAIAGVISIALFSRVKECIPPGSQIAQPNTKFFKQWDMVRENPALAVFLLATTLSGFGNMLVSPIYQIIQVHVLNLNNLQIGYVRVAYFLFLLLAYLTMGSIIDRFSPRHALLAGIAAYAIAPLLYGLFGTYSAVIVASSFQGIGDAIWDIGCLSYVFKIAPGREAIAFGFHLMLFGVRGTIGPLIGTSLAHASSSMHFVLFAASIFSVTGLLVLAILGNPRNASAHGRLSTDEQTLNL